MILKNIALLTIPPSNYSTSGININQVYDYSLTPAKLVGATAGQSLNLVLGNLQTLNQLLKSLEGANASVSNLVFDLSDQRNALKNARTAAYRDALRKFVQYLLLTGQRSAGLKQVTDLNTEVYTPYQSNPELYALRNKLSAPASKVEVSASVEVVWETKR